MAGADCDMAAVVDVHQSTLDAATASSNRLAPFNPTSDDAIEVALRLASLNSDDVVIDLGCGDGRVLIAAAASNGGVHATGIEYDQSTYERAVQRLASQPDDIQRRVTLIHGDATAADLSAATVIFVYLVPTGLDRVRGALRDAVDRGARVVSNIFSLKGWHADGLLRQKVATKSGLAVYLYAKPEG